MTEAIQCKFGKCKKPADVAIFGKIVEKTNRAIYHHIVSVPLCLEHYDASPWFELYHAIPLSEQGRLRLAN